MPTQISGTTGVSLVQDGVIVDADINSAANINGLKIASGTVGTAQLSANSIPVILGNQVGAFSFRNKIINGGMLIDQRNNGAVRTISVGTNVYSLDRWYGAALGAAVTHQRISVTAPRVSFALRITGAAGNTSTWVAQRIESTFAAQIAGLPVTLSFYAASSTLTQLRIGYGAAGSADNYSSTTNDTTFDIPITSTLTRYTINFTAPSTFNNGFYLGFYSNGPLLAGQTMTITGVQLEEGSIATPFENRPVGLELTLCQRYYEIVRALWNGNTTGATSYGGFTPFRVEKRAVPNRDSTISSAGYGNGGAGTRSISDFYTYGIVVAAYWGSTLNAGGFNDVYGIAAEL